MAEKRKLTEAEQKRLKKFEKTIEEYKAEGYTPVDLTLTSAKANVLALIYGLIVSVPFIVIYLITSWGTDYTLSKYPLFGSSFLLGLMVLLLLVSGLLVVHELIHGITWSIFAKGGFRNIEFGVNWKALAPYCTCSEPFKKPQYITGALMPLLLLGIVPSVIAILTKDYLLITIGVMMILGAGGDMAIVKMILSDKSGPDSLYMDHPTDIGSVALRK